MVNCELAIAVSKQNDAIIKDTKKCLNCGYCTKICQNDIMITKKNYDIESVCLKCGQCANICPTESIHERFHYLKVKNLLQNKKDKIVVFNLSPLTGISLKETFPVVDEIDLTGKIITALKTLGVNYVFDLTSSMDIAVTETSYELLNHLNKKSSMPLFTSHCPAWIKYCEIFYPNILPHLAKTKNTNIIQGNLIKTYFADILNVEPQKIINITVSPCMAVKSEINNQALSITNKDTDYILTIRELALLLKDTNIILNDLAVSSFDTPLNVSSNSGIISEASGGLAEAILRTTNYLLTGKNLLKKDLNFLPLRGMNGFKEVTAILGDRTIKVAVCNGLKTAANLIEKIVKKEVAYDLVEVMCCPGGCIAGGGMPKITVLNNAEVKNNRLDSLYAIANQSHYVFSYRNKEVMAIYKKNIDEAVLHTKYHDKSYLLGGKND